MKWRVKSMAQLNANISSELDKEFRETVYKKKGLKRGVLLESLEEAIKLWILEQKNKEQG